jgi:hypothetical protein
MKTLAERGIGGISLTGAATNKAGSGKKRRHQQWHLSQV